MVSQNMLQKPVIWVVDGIAEVRYLKLTPSYQAWMKSLIKIVTLKAKMNASELNIVNDTYPNKSVKNDTRENSGQDWTKRSSGKM